MRDVAVAAQDKGLELLLDIAADVPDAVVGDAGRLRQVVLNLLSNAVKFTAAGEVVLSVGVDAVDDTQVTLHLTVRDTGIGIAPDKQRDDLRGVHAGRHLDDARVRRHRAGPGDLRAARGHDGRASLGGKRAGRGQHIPCHGATRSRSPRAGRAVAEPVASLDGVPVLIVDDNATNRRILSDTLTSLGSESRGGRGRRVGDGRARRSRSGPGRRSRVVLLDLRMPGMDGFDVAGQIARPVAGAGPVAIMMLTSQERRDMAARCRELGIASHLVKPVRRIELRRALERALGLSRRGRAPKGSAAMPVSARRARCVSCWRKTTR